MAATINPLTQIEIGIGSYAWGDRMVWGYGRGSYNDEDIEKAFHVCIERGIKLFDTAEVYGSGHAETLLGKFIRNSKTNLIIASKFMPYPWRLNMNSLSSALRRSLQRLQIDRIHLYQIHWPLPPVRVETWMESLSRLRYQGLIDEMGVSNYNLEQTIRSHDTLTKLGWRLCSNQLEYNLLNRQIEKNGVMAYCRENGIRVIAYSPLAQGSLSGKYTPANPPQGIRGYRHNGGYLQKIQPLIFALSMIGEDHGGKTPAQVAINWTICKGTLPIPGVKNAEQAEQNTGSVGWRLTEAEIEKLDQISEKVTAH